MRQLRKKRRLEEEEGEEDGDTEAEAARSTALEDLKFLQKYRAAKAGMNAQTLLQGMARAPGGEEEEHYGLRRRDEEEGGQLQESYVAGQVKDENAVDPEMAKYVETQLAKRLGRDSSSQPQGGEAGGQAYQDPEAELYAMPENLKVKPTRKQDVAAYLTGILEVPLSVDQKLRNIEETEATKQRLLREQGRPGDAPDEAPAVGLSSGIPRALYPRDFGPQNDGEVERRVQAVITALTTDKPSWKDKKKRR